MVWGIVFASISSVQAISASAENYTDEDELLQSIDSSVQVVLTTIATKKEENLSDAPGVITVITHDEIRQFGGMTLGDVIQRAPSLQFIGSHLFPQNAMIMRGDLQTHYDNHILILINGRPFRDDIAGGQNATLYEAFPIAVIERIEFVRGPGSVLYGTNAFDGMINIITKKSGRNMEADITAGGGSFGGMLGQATGGCKGEKFDIVANVNGFRDDGWDFEATTVFPSAAQDITGSMKYYRHDISGSLFAKGMGFSFNAFYATAKRGNLGLSPIWQMGGDGESWINESRTFVDAGYSRKVFNNFQINANATYNYCGFYSHALQTSSTENSHSVLGEVTIGGPIVDRLNFIVGNALINRWNEEVAGARIPADRALYYYAYTQIDYTPIDKIKLFAGAQYNKPPAIKGVFVPRIGAVIHATGFFGAKINYAEAFRSAMPLETSTYFPGVVVGNATLKPEMVATTDFQAFFIHKKIQLDACLFQSDYKDLIARIPHPSITNTVTYTNTGTMKIRGLEANGKLTLIPQLFLEGSATCQKEVNDKTLTPSYLAKGGITYAAPFGVTVGLFNNYYGTPKPNTMGKMVNPEAKGVHLVSMNISCGLPFYRPVKFNCYINNVFDRDYYYPEFNKKWINTLPLEPGRAIYGTVTYSF